MEAIKTKIGHKETKMCLKLICSYNMWDAEQSNFVPFYRTSMLKKDFFLIKWMIYPLTHLQNR